MAKKTTTTKKKTAKKAAPKPETTPETTAPATAPAVPTRGQKVCPQCAKIVGAAARRCECGHEFVAKTKAPKTGKRGRKAKTTAPAPATDLAAIQAAARFVQKVGGLDQAAAALAVVKAVIVDGGAEIG